MGFERVRKLADPRWQVDAAWVAQVIEREIHPIGYAHSPNSPELDAALRRALAAVKRHPFTSSGLKDPDTSWDEALEAIDAALAVRQAEHIAGVIEGGCSGHHGP